MGPFGDSRKWLLTPPVSETYTEQMGRSPRNKTVADRTVTVRLTRAEVQTLKKASFRHESIGQTLRRLALSPSPQPTQS